MIEEQISRSGKPVLKKEGRFLASSVDPENEAEIWAEAARAKMRDLPYETAVILGLGCGYHVSALKRRLTRARVVVVETDRDVMTWAQSQTNKVESFEDVLFAPTLHDFLKLESLRDIINSVLRIHVHQASAHANLFVYEAIRSFLIGREPSFFRSNVALRGTMCALGEQSIADPSSDGLLSIKNLQGLMSSVSLESRERRIWSVLEELIR